MTDSYRKLAASLFTLYSSYCFISVELHINYREMIVKGVLQRLMFLSALLSSRSTAKVSLILSSHLNLFRLHGGSTSSEKKNEKNEGNVGSTATNINETDSSTIPMFTKVSEKLVYDGWRKVSQKEVIMPNKKTVTFDVVTQKSPSVTVFVWDRQSSTATLVQEYHPGMEKMIFGAVAGGFESHKHTTPLECAMSELEEEAQLASDTWIPLLEDHSTTVPFEKYSDNKFYPYLALDCTPILNPKPMDDEEFIVVHRNVSHSRLMEMISHGELNIISSYTVLMGIRKLLQLGIPLEKE